MVFDMFVAVLMIVRAARWATHRQRRRRNWNGFSAACSWSGAVWARSCSRWDWRLRCCGRRTQPVTGCFAPALPSTGM